jgi:ATP-dependent Lon protease
VIGLHGSAGVGKTSLARSGIAEALQRPFEFFSLGGASDIANFTGHSYTYEGSLWGRIVDSLMHAKCMNPVMYFDELDKISTTPHGEEIASMLIHMTDRSQNSQFHDRYFAGVDLDLSQCLFVFSFNDIHAVHPILRDRMQIVHCSGYSDKDKKHILQDYVWPKLLDRLKFSTDDIALPESTMDYLISEYSADEKGVRSLIRVAETMITRLNMLRIADMQDYKFYISTEFPMVLTPDICKTLLHDAVAKEPETWRSMYN